nr:MAG TPA: hypothetical protein [Caudoviricetes sp.]
MQVLINIPVKLSTGNWIERLPFKRWRQPLTKRNLHLRQIVTQTAKEVFG